LFISQLIEGITRKQDTTNYKHLDAEYPIEVQNKK